MDSRERRAALQLEERPGEFRVPENLLISGPSVLVYNPGDEVIQASAAN